MNPLAVRGLQAAGLVLAGMLASCAEDTPESDLSYDIVVSDPLWVVPSDALPSAAPAQAANNNLSIFLFEDRLFLAWRTAPSHFASAETRMHVISSPDLGQTWDYETTFHAGTDLREPLLYEAQGILYLTFFEAGTDPLAFEPNNPWRSSRNGPGDWAYPQQWGAEGEVPWEVVQHAGKFYLTSYLGPHYEIGEPGDLDVRFRWSSDGVSWLPVGKTGPVVYHGGGSEAAFEFGPAGDLWAALRNEDGDDTGFGTLLCHAPADHLERWNCPDVSDPERYDSPRMFRHEDEIYMVARRDIDGPYDQSDPETTFAEQQLTNLLSYSGRAKRTAVYRIDRDAGQVVHLMDLPSAGDTSFPSIQQLGDHTFLVGNYTSPLDDPDISWIDGQVAEDGTQIYLLTLTFVPTP